MRKRIPAPVISVVSEVVAGSETHATLDSLFTYAGAPGEPPEGSKLKKAQQWLRDVNKDESVDPMKVLGLLVEGYMEADPENTNYYGVIPPREKIEKIEKALSRAELHYSKGGHIIDYVGAPSKSLESIIKGHDISSINEEFDRALKNVETNPKEAVSAACNILESICKIYIEDEGLEAPQKLDLHPVWNLVRKDLGFDPCKVEDRDLKEILSGMIATVNGIAALRSHASSAHGSGRNAYKLEPRHARLAIHAAHTVAAFTIESWNKKRKNNG